MNWVCKLLIDRAHGPVAPFLCNVGFCPTYLEISST
jgi:hypothetical protein